MVVSMLVGFIAVISGLLISFHYGTAGGATMAGISVLEFFIVMIVQSTYRTFRKNTAEEETEYVEAL
jgi:ABC-type Mn2+/Zn2+ transport system permease subunit